MNRIDKIIREKEKILSIYFTAGYPEKNSVITLIKALEENGADMVEVGIPFSDPLADGPVIQESSKVALENGITLKDIFSQLKDLRQQTEIPVILMGYLNPVLQYGIEKFLSDARDCSIDGVILPDLPPEEYEAKYISLFEQYGIYPIFLITPQTPPERLKRIDSLSKGFVYAVSSSSTTGSKSGFAPEQTTYFKRLAESKLRNPVMVGFGISNKATLDTVYTYAKGAIVGSAFIKSIDSNADDFGVKKFMTNLKTAEA